MPAPILPSADQYETLPAGDKKVAVGKLVIFPKGGALVLTNKLDEKSSPYVTLYAEGVEWQVDRTKEVRVRRG